METNRLVEYDMDGKTIWSVDLSVLAADWMSMACSTQPVALRSKARGRKLRGLWPCVNFRNLRFPGRWQNLTVQCHGT
jgi:hypothetical protein